MQARYDSQNPQALARILAKGIQLRPFAKDILDAAFTTSQELLEDYASKDKTFNTVFSAWKKAKEQSFTWFGTTEATYAGYAFNKK